jgi:hypothetical protein
MVWFCVAQISRFFLDKETLLGLRIQGMVLSPSPPNRMDFAQAWWMLPRKKQRHAFVCGHTLVVVVAKGSRPSSIRISSYHTLTMQWPRTTKLTQSTSDAWCMLDKQLIHASLDGRFQPRNGDQTLEQILLEYYGNEKQDYLIDNVPVNNPLFMVLTLHTTPVPNRNSRRVYVLDWEDNRLHVPLWVSSSS